MLETQEVKMEITRNRVLRTKTCLPDSNYKVNCEKVITKDLLILNVFDKNDLDNPIYTYRFSGAKLTNKKSFHH